ncbi:MAG: DsbA family protein [Alphaproteobacteria bacterium]|nr:DsbA family protein [Alphaproteobacteria bacterium]
MRNKIVFFLVPVVVLLAIGGVGAVWMKSANETEGDLTQAAIEQPANAPEANIDPASGENAPAPTEAPAPVATTETPAAAPAATPAAPVATATPEAGPIDPATIVVEGTDPKAPRSLGSLDAPVTMYDFSSLTCPHCAHAHETVLPYLIRDYVQTGKLRIVFRDFPLNLQAMDASKVSRCMSPERYYAFITMLFSSVEQWAAHHPDQLIQNAVLAGLSPDKAKSCIADKETEDAIIAGVQEGAEKYHVEATPTFVFNDGAKVISGARPYIDFQMAIDGLLEEAKDKAARAADDKATVTETTPAPAATPEENLPPVE